MDDLTLGRELGTITQRLNGQDAAIARIEKAQTDGFEHIGKKLDSLIAERNARRGFVGFVKMIFGSGVIASVFELLTRHKR